MESGVPQHLWEFARDRDMMTSAATQIRLLLIDLLDEAGIQTHAIESRAKSIDSYRRKAEVLRSPGVPKYSDPRSEISDCVAMRVIVFTRSAREEVNKLIRSRFEVREELNPGEIKRNGYDSDHFIISGVSSPLHMGNRGDLVAYFDNRPGLEVQVRTVAGHAWAEYEHDIRYKPSGYSELSAGQRLHVDQLFVEAGGFRRYLDEIFDQIDSLVTVPGSSGNGLLERDVVPDGDDLDIEAESLTKYLLARYPDARSAADDEIEQSVLDLRRAGLKTFGDLDKLLQAIDSDQVETLMRYRVRPSGVRRLEDDLLAAGPDQVVAAAEAADRERVDGRDDRALFLSSRSKRVRGKVLIYEIEGVFELKGALFSAARAFREIVKVVANAAGTAQAVVSGITSLTDNLPPSVRPVEMQTERGRIWVATNLTRAASEVYINEILSRFSARDVRVLRAGELIASSV